MATYLFLSHKSGRESDVECNHTFPSHTLVNDGCSLLTIYAGGLETQGIVYSVKGEKNSANFMKLIF